MSNETYKAKEMNYSFTYPHSLTALCPIPFGSRMSKIRSLAKELLFRMKRLLFGLRNYLAVSSVRSENVSDDEVRFLELADRYSDTISRICYSFADNLDDYQDLRQDTLINLWRGLCGFRGDADISTWVYRVTMNTCVSRWRSARFRRERFIPLESVTDVPVADNRPLRDDIEQLHVLLSTLPALDRSLIILWLEERSYEEIADLTGLKRNTVASRLHRIRERLANTVQEKRI